MASYTQRLDKIEQRINPNSVRIVWVDEDDTEADAKAKAEPHNGKTIFVRWLKSDRDL